MISSKLAVHATDTLEIERAKQFADDHQLSYVDRMNGFDFFLIFTPEYVGLQPNQRQSKCIVVDFTTPAMLTRIRSSNRKSELLIKAMGTKVSRDTSIIDATCGLGKDAFLLAAFGLHVTAIERSPIVHLLLADGLRRAKLSIQTEAIARRIDLHLGDASQRLLTLERTPLVYLDPMFDADHRTAAAKKQMQALQQLLHANQDDRNLLNVALTCAMRRVVVKRPRISTHLANHVPNYSIYGKSMRFDVYLVT